MTGSLLFSVFVFLVAACVAVPVCKRLGLGSVIGYLIAGIVIGPFGLKLITEPTTILHFSEFGVVMMLFIIGLELEPKSLWSMRGKLIGQGASQVVLTTLIIMGGALLLGLNWPEALVLGMALALSSTAIAMQLIGERELMDVGAGRSGFSILLFQDIIVIPMIAALPLIAVYAGFDGAAEVDHSSGITLTGLPLAGAIVGTFAGMIAAGHFLMPAILRFVTRFGSRETLTAIALLLVIGSALLMGVLGLSAALGAFVAGVILAGSEYRHQLERDIEPFKALLLGLFFISVGMQIDFDVLKSAPITVAGLVFGLVAVKFIVLIVIAKTSKLNWPDSTLLAILLAQGGEFAFVMFQFARSEGAISAESVSLLTPVIALSMAMTPLLLLLHDRVIFPVFFKGASKTGPSPISDLNANVMVLGFGRVGQIATRLLQTQNINCTIIDKDGEHIELVKKFGHKVYFGDAGDIDLLHTAGAAHADVIILALDAPNRIAEMAHNIREHFPKARIVARARGRATLFELMTENVDFVERETLRGALMMGQKTLEFLGWPESKAANLSERFLDADFKVAQSTYQMRGNVEELAAKSEQNQAYLMQLLTADSADPYNPPTEADIEAAPLTPKKTTQPNSAKVSPKKH